MQKYLYLELALQESLRLGYCKTTELQISRYWKLTLANRIGGRIRNTSFGGVTIELGAYWIHKSPKDSTVVRDPMVNPIWTLVHDPINVPTRVH